MKMDFIKFLEQYDLGIGSIVSVENDNSTYRIIKSKNQIMLENTQNNSIHYLTFLDGKEVKKVKPKKVGDFSCNEYFQKYSCDNCIFFKLNIRCNDLGSVNDTLFEIKKILFKDFPKTKILASVIDKELNKEVEDEQK